MIEIIIIALLVGSFVGFMVARGFKKARKDVTEAMHHADMVIRALDHIEKGHFQTAEEKAKNQKINELGRERWGKY